MTLATHRTQAPTARKRGGGPAQDLQMNASAHGRHPLPEGGEINSLCRAAAGIIPSLPAGSGAHVYPTKGVRGGAEDVHRSATPPTPAAQPVKGYKPLGTRAEKDRFPSRETLQTLARAFYGVPHTNPEGNAYALSAAHCRRLRLLDGANQLTELGLTTLRMGAQEPRHQAQRSAA